MGEKIGQKIVEEYQIEKKSLKYDSDFCWDGYEKKGWVIQEEKTRNTQKKDFRPNNYFAKYDKGKNVSLTLGEVNEFMVENTIENQPIFDVG